jgi:DNA-binding GntR family transcriptional regulator
MYGRAAGLTTATARRTIPKVVGAGECETEKPVTARSADGNNRQAQGEIAYAQIKRDIIRCRLAPGEQTSRAQLAKRYGFGQSVVRYALERLVQEQLVQALPREGYVVTPVTIGLFNDRMTARLAVEPAVARLAAGVMKTEEIESLREITERASGIDEAISANRRLHLAIAQATRSEKLVQIVANLVDEGERIWYFTTVLLKNDLVGRERPEHESILDALGAGDGAAAAHAMTAHLEASRTHFVGLLILNPSVQHVSLMAVD